MMWSSDGPALQVDSWPPARPPPPPPPPSQPPPARPAQIPAPPGSPAEPAPEHNYSPCSPFRAICSSSPGSHHGPPAGPAPERKRMKNLRLLMKRREQSGSSSSDQDHPQKAAEDQLLSPDPREPLEPAAPWENQPVGNIPVKKSIRLLMKKRTQVGGAVRHSKKV
ncbi:hypothetical protein F7725_009753 [Dissostichus mawsoni]|uniref:Uncharacterized protein n=1 Tax=Dissostichus mawsoni TaxID=36200 RepID=A0A7J5XLL9_DISMA|nr:hypothetical protein F7725_009753 [Dissostichus mawsoni]